MILSLFPLPKTLTNPIIKLTSSISICINSVTRMPVAYNNSKIVRSRYPLFLVKSGVSSNWITSSTSKTSGSFFSYLGVSIKTVGSLAAYFSRKANWWKLRIVEINLAMDFAEAPWSIREPRHSCIVCLSIKPIWAIFCSCIYNWYFFKSLR